MTCIVAVAGGGRVVMGADSAGVDAGRYSLCVRADRKVFRNGDFVMGFTSSFRMGQLLAYSLSPPKPRVGVDVMAYMATEFIDAVRDCLKAGGFATTHDGGELGGMFLVGYTGRLFKVDCDYHIGESAHGFDACGCGDLIALGSLSATKKHKAEDRVRMALEAAECFSAGVRGPFHIEVAP